MGYPTKSDYVDEVDVDTERFDALPGEEALDATVENVRQRNVDVEVFETGGAAREYLLDLIEPGTEVNKGTSTTLNEIGFTEEVEAAEGFTYLPDRIRDIDDDEARLAARREAQAADLWFDSPNAVAETGEIVGVNASGSGIGPWTYSAGELVLVTGTNKIVPSFEDAVARCREFALPLEDARAREVYDAESVIGKLVSLEYERSEGRTTLVLINERFGF